MRHARCHGYASPCGALEASESRIADSCFLDRPRITEVTQAVGQKEFLDTVLGTRVLSLKKN